MLSGTRVRWLKEESIHFTTLEHDAMADQHRRLLPGTVDVLILKSLTGGPQHGFGVTRTIRKGSGGVLGVEDAALYQALHRIERKGWIESEWGLSENNRRAKFYSLTPEGTQQLNEEMASWEEYSEAVSRMLKQS